MAQEHLEREGLEFMATVLEQSMTVTQNITERVENGQRLEIIQAHAELYAVRESINRLYQNPYMPNAAHVLAALNYPNPALVEGFRVQYAYERGWDPDTGAVID